MNFPRADSVATFLEEAILRGDYQDGEKLDEIRLANEFGVSRTPIREAFLKLSSSGLIDQIPNRGAYVCQPGPVELVELFEMMGELESSCARLAAMRISESAIDELLEANKACKLAVEAANPNAYYDHNETFHLTIYSQSGNRVLEADTLRLHQRLKPYRRIQLQARGRLTQSMAEHEAIVGALISGDSVKASDLMRDHVTIQGEKFNNLLRLTPDRILVNK
ncbi:MAG: GntR family transcriptional regulator [Granulosicoccus sp.]